MALRMPSWRGDDPGMGDINVGDYDADGYIAPGDAGKTPIFDRWGSRGLRRKVGGGVLVLSLAIAVVIWAGSGDDAVRPQPVIPAGKVADPSSTPTTGSVTAATTAPAPAASTAPVPRGRITVNGREVPSTRPRVTTSPSAATAKPSVTPSPRPSSRPTTASPVAVAVGIGIGIAQRGADDEVHALTRP